MHTIRLGRTEVTVPAVGFGTWPHSGPNHAGEVEVGWSGHDDELARAALRTAYELGETHWDTADVYGDGRAERLIGEVLAEVDRDGIFIASKVGWDPGPHDRFYHPRLIEAHLHRSLQNLSVEHIDLYYLHHCDFGPKGEYLDDALLTFRRLRTQGKIRFIGLSDWNSRRVLKYVDRVRPDVIQICRNVCNDEYVESGLKRWADANDVGVVFFSPLDHGLLLGKYTEPTSFPSGDTRNRVDGFRDRRLLLRLGDNREKLIQRFDGHPEPVLHGLMGSLMADSPQACVLVGQRNPDQVRAAVAAAEPVSPTDAAWVNSLYDCETEGGLQSGE